MNNLNKKIGITSSIIIIVGCLLKAFHLQGAAVVLTSGFLIFSLIFMPSIIFLIQTYKLEFLLTKNNKILFNMMLKSTYNVKN